MEGVEMGKKHEREARRAAAKSKETGGPVDASMPKPVGKVKPVKAGALPGLPRIPSSAKPKKAAQQQPCTCGCGTPTAKMWAPGHDARANGWALRIERGLIKMSDVPANEQAGAKHMLKARKEAGSTEAPAPKSAKPKLVKGIKAAEPKAEEPKVETEAVNS
jgi:hypothetical protein